MIVSNVIPCLSHKFQIPFHWTVCGFISLETLHEKHMRFDDVKLISDLYNSTHSLVKDQIIHANILHAGDL